MKRSIKSNILAVFIAALTVSSFAEKRVWSGKNGSTVEAEFVSITGSNVTLKKTSGKTISIPISKLSIEDQAYLKEKAESSAPVAQKDEFYAMKIIFSSDEEAASFEIHPPWDSGLHIIEKRCQLLTDARKENLPPPVKLKNWGYERTHISGMESHDIYNEKEISIEYIVYLPAGNTDDLKISSSNSCEIRILGFNPETEKKKDIEKFRGKRNKDNEFSVGLIDIQSRCALVKYNPSK